MSEKPTQPRGPDLDALAAEGFQLDLGFPGRITVKGIPYACKDGEVRYGTIHAALATQGGVVVQPDRHWAVWEGTMPYDEDGNPLNKLMAAMPLDMALAWDLRNTFLLSAKPPQGFESYYEMIRHYASRIGRGVDGLQPGTGVAEPVIGRAL